MTPMQKIGLAIAVLSVLVIVIRKAIAYENDSVADAASASFQPLMPRGNSHASL
jgi:hypothetical protein